MATLATQTPSSSASSTPGLLGGWRMALRRLIAPKKPEPSYPTLPLCDAQGQSSVRGIYLAGELAGTPLIKLGLNAGVDVADAIADELGAPAAADGAVDLLIVGAGSAGLSAALRARERGLSVRVLEAGRTAQTVHDMYVGKRLFAEPDGVDNRSALWFAECTREELLARWQSQLATAALDLREHDRVLSVQRRGELFEIDSEGGRHHARRVLLAMGKAGNPRKAGVPGEREHAERVLHRLADPDGYHDQRIFIYGGGDVAAESALALAPHNQVTLVTIDRELVHARPAYRQRLQQLAAEGALALHVDSRLREIGERSVQFEDASGRTHEVAADTVFEMIGAELPKPFFRKLGIALEGDWNARRYALLLAMFVGVYALYALKKYPESPYSWPFDRLIARDAYVAGLRALFEPAFAPFAWAFTPQAYQQMLDTLWFQQGYLYSLLYTLVMIVFGAQALLRWQRIARDPRYQQLRYASLIAFQVAFFLIANVLAVQALSIQYAWRAWGLYQPWPLFFNTFHWWNASDPRVLLYGFVGAGVLGTLVLIPWASHRHGKRFCTFVCGCGGLAETLGDRVRHLSPKGQRSRDWEFQSLLILAAATIATLVSIGAYGTRADNPWAQAYSYVVDFWLVAVIPIALYPFFGGKVWCRYYCPLAAFNGLLAKLYGKLEIRSNDRCISCTQCSRHCQVGVDVMQFAKQAQAFDNRNSACIQCGICIDVCPMDVLSFAQRDDAPRRRLPVVGAGS